MATAGFGYYGVIDERELPALPDFWFQWKMSPDDWVQAVNTLNDKEFILWREGERMLLHPYVMGPHGKKVMRRSFSIELER